MPKPWENAEGYHDLTAYHGTKNIIRDEDEQQKRVNTLILSLIHISSYYPSLMLVYKWLSRNVHDPSKYAEIYHTRLKLKAEKNPMQQPYKIVLNSTYGAMKAC